jgi:hypothetical protein
MKKSEIPEVDARGDRFREYSVLHSQVVIVACNEIDVRDVKDKVTVFRILPEEVEVTLLYS